MNRDNLSRWGTLRSGASRGASGSSLTNRGRGGLGNQRGPPQTLNNQASSSSLHRNTIVQYVSGGSTQRAPEHAPLLNRRPHPEHDPPTDSRLPYSPRGRTYLPPSVEGEPETGIEAFPDPCISMFDAYVAASNNRKIFTLELREHYRRHLRNPLVGAQGRTTAEKSKDSNRRTHALRSFCLEQEQLYLRAGQFGNTYFQNRYVVCTNDAFIIITDAHKYLIHAGKSYPKLTSFTRD
jgi:hypothetical protein